MDLAAHPFPGTERVKAFKGASDGESSADDVSGAIPHLSEDDSADMDSDDDAEIERLSDEPGSTTVSEDGIVDVSFGALAKAQSSLGKRKRINDGPYSVGPEPYQSLHAYRDNESDKEALERKAGKRDTRDFARGSKHAPAEQSSKKAVSRKRGVVPVPKRPIRDPRFESLSGPLHADKFRKNFAFLDTYRQSEMAELRAGIRKTKDPTARETLKRALTSMESRKKAQEMNDQRQDVLRRHRKEERERVEAGKKPFYLKKAEVKERALVERFKGMKGKQVEKAIERRRKKQTAKERKGMPDERRG